MRGAGLEMDSSKRSSPLNRPSSCDLTPCEGKNISNLETGVQIAFAYALSFDLVQVAVRGRVELSRPQTPRRIHCSRPINSSARAAHIYTYGYPIHLFEKGIFALNIRSSQHRERPLRVFLL